MTIGVPTIRTETDADEAGVYAVNVAAFPAADEAKLVDLLRESASPLISLVAEDGGEIVGHILFSPVTIDGGRGLQLMGLAPMAVEPGRQNQGIGSSLVEAGLQACRDLGVAAVVVLGHPEYYPRFGFKPASIHNIGCEYDVPDEVFMVTELVPGCLDNVQGEVRYHEAIAALG